MNNVVDFTKSPYQTTSRADYFPQESDLYFKTYERDVYFKGNELDYPISNYKSIIRMDRETPIPIGLVGRNYKVLPMEDLCHHVEDTFCDVMSKEQLDGARTVDQTSYYGGVCMRQYIFPSINEDIGSRVSQVGFRTIITNGYDGSSSVKFYSGAIDFFCTNGMVTGAYDLVTKKHTSGLTIPSLTKNLKNSIDIFYKQADQWRHWVGKEISDEDATTVLEAIPGISTRRTEQLLRQFHIECMHHGRTVWALYSAATYYASHPEEDFKIRDTGMDNQASTLLNREKQIRSWLNTDEFERIAA